MGLNRVISKLIVWKKRSHMGNDSVVVVLVYKLYLRILNEHNNDSFNCVMYIFPYISQKHCTLVASIQFLSTYWNSGCTIKHECKLQFYVVVVFNPILIKVLLLYMQREIHNTQSYYTFWVAHWQAHGQIYISLL